jgi:hypothetical protein
MLVRRLISSPLHLWRWWAECAHQVEAVRDRRKAVEANREARGIALLREWLSSEQQAQFDAFRHFDVIGSDTGRRYRVRHARTMGVHEMDAAGRPIAGWCFLPTGPLVTGDIMLAQKIALETNELAALAVANRFPIDGDPTNASRAASFPGAPGGR